MNTDARLGFWSLGLLAALALNACGGGGGGSSDPGVDPSPVTGPTTVIGPAPSTLSDRRTSANVFYTGHSLMDDPFAADTQRIAESLSASNRWNQQIAIGSPLRYRTRGLDTSSPAFPGYQLGKNRDGFDMDVVAELRSPQTIGDQRYDTLVLTERHDIASTLQWEDTVRYARHFFDRAIEGNAQTRGFVYHSWLSLSDRSDPSAWIAYEREAAPAWQCVVGRINASLAAEGRPQRMQYLPAGLALAHLVDESMKGRVAGLSGSPAAIVQQLFQDSVHPTPLGSYFLSLVNYASVYRHAPNGAWAPDGVSDALKTSLQNTAWQVVGSYYANEVNRSPAECSALMRDRFCSVFWTYLGQADQTAACRNHFARQDAGNAFYFDPASDRNYWFPAP